MADDPDEDVEETGPERRCVATGLVKPKAELLRFVVAPDGMLVPDMGHALPGRGIWLSPRRDVVNTAVAKRLFAKAARRQVSVPEDLAERVGELLARRCLDALGLARRAGQAVMGFEKVCAEVRAGRAGLVLAARDASRDGRDKVRALGAGLAVIELFDGAELGAVFGRETAVHVCMSPGKLALRLQGEAAMLAGFRDGGSGDVAGTA
ncbi:hypothetical protein CU669_11520 [Paramagnetospirillum kuznetsovii]|uniref:YlxR domain-containing protein n=1 Tax=Paramagnetospirillum kuznetsovii TaxID=2053833 RepID=A0A364NXW4_9PROT|nr:RNA-binding protein [Paramagnetospirillum kuznetsovii]RAU21919.1 hypothetical protein CU669_11520 [Paramagnetospirillum kuznetsovii]